MRFVADENFDNRIFRGLLRRKPGLDIARVQDLEIAGSDDDTVLAWAAHAERILLTHDQRTVPKYAYECVRRGEAVAGAISRYSREVSSSYLFLLGLLVLLKPDRNAGAESVG